MIKYFIILQLFTIGSGTEAQRLLMFKGGKNRVVYYKTGDVISFREEKGSW